MLLQPLHYEFFVRSLLVGALLGLACGALGCFVMLRGMAFLGDAMAHAVLPGIVIAYLCGTSLMSGALAASLLTAALIGLLSGSGKVSEDTAIGIVFTGAFALGIVLISRVQNYIQDLTHFLLGNILGLAGSDVWWTIGVTLLVLACLGLWYRELALFTFDPTHAAAIGLKPGRLRIGLLLLMALTIVVGIGAVGVVLIASLLITPAATARLLTDRLTVMIKLAALLGAGAAVVGLYASYYLGLAAGASIVLTSTLLFVVALVSSALRAT